jgi:hypothetical protein
MKTQTIRTTIEVELIVPHNWYVSHGGIRDEEGRAHVPVVILTRGEMGRAMMVPDGVDVVTESVRFDWS